MLFRHDSMSFSYTLTSIASSPTSQASAQVHLTFLSSTSLIPLYTFNLSCTHCAMQHFIIFPYLVISFFPISIQPITSLHTSTPPLPLLNTIKHFTFPLYLSPSPHYLSSHDKFCFIHALSKCIYSSLHHWTPVT